MAVSLYSKVVKVSEDFLGPAGERFIRRQIVTHLNIEPENLEGKHLAELVEWIRLASAVITRDIDQVDAFVERLRELSSSKEGSRGSAR